MTYEHSLHVLERMEERAISLDEIACAPGRGSIRILDWCVVAYYDRLTGVVAIVDAMYRCVVTAWRE